MKKIEQIALQATFNKATTTVDGGWRLVFDCPEDAGEQILEVQKLSRDALFLVIMKEEDFNKR